MDDAMSSRAGTIRFRTGKKPHMTVEMRFYEKVGLPDANGCMLWLAGRDSKQAGQQYGMFWSGLRDVTAHRFSYILANGKIPDGLEIDHLCRVRLCVNPNHLEAVTHLVNIRRGHGWGTSGLCKYGHPLDGWKSRGHRYCKTCARAALRRCLEKKARNRQ